MFSSESCPFLHGNKKRERHRRPDTIERRTLARISDCRLEIIHPVLFNEPVQVLLVLIAYIDKLYAALIAGFPIHILLLAPYHTPFQSNVREIRMEQNLHVYKFADIELHRRDILDSNDINVLCHNPEGLFMLIALAVDRQEHANTLQLSPIVSGLHYLAASLHKFLEKLPHMYPPNLLRIFYLYCSGSGHIMPPSKELIPGNAGPIMDSVF